MRCRRGLIVAALVSTGAWGLPSAASAARVVYVNMDSVMVLDGAGVNDPTMDKVAVNGYTPTTFPGWTGATEKERDELLYVMKEVAVNYDVVFTAERPQTGTYDMLVFGAEATHAAAFGGQCSSAVGLSDCTDQNGESISFAFWGCLPEQDHLNVDRVAQSALKALGFSWGMENVTVSGLVMGNYSITGLKYGQACSSISGMNSCSHETCGAGQQNGSADMMARFGGRVDDATAGSRIEWRLFRNDQKDGKPETIVTPAPPAGSPPLPAEILTPIAARTATAIAAERPAMAY